MNIIPDINMKEITEEILSIYLIFCLKRIITTLSIFSFVEFLK